MSSKYTPPKHYPVDLGEDLLPASLLERHFGKPCAQWTADDLVDLVHEKGLRLVSLMHVGGDGRLKALDFVPRDLTHLREVLRSGERADGSSLFANVGVRPGASDILLKPRLRSAFLDPFAWEPTLCLFCGHMGRDGEPLAESPDTIAQRAFARAREEAGVDLYALGEVEYFLGKRTEQGDVCGTDDCGYHATSPFVYGEGLRRQAMVLLANMGVPVKYGHSEVGYIPTERRDDLLWEQHEIELALLPLPRAAEAVVLTSWVLRNLAHKAGMSCSFEPIVRPGHAGSGLHIHLSPMVRGEHRGGENRQGQLHDEAKWLIGGLASIGGALMAFGNTEPSSFVRLSQGKEAPNTVTWGPFNRKVLVRLPVVARDKKGVPLMPPTVEFRLPDGSAYPHLLLAGIAQGFLMGKEMKNLEAFLEKTKADENSVGVGVEKVPRDFAEVAELLVSHRGALEAGGVFAETVINRFVHILSAKAEATPML